MPADRVALVTGAGGAIGGRIAARLAADGFTVVGTDLQDAPPADAAFDAYHRADVAEAGAIDRIVAAVVEAFGRLDAAVAAAGIVSRSGILDTSPEELDQAFDVNAKGCFYTVQAAYRQMVDGGGGRIVAIGSLAASVGGVFAGPAYSASKAAVEGLVRSAAKSGAEHGILVNVVAPGVTESPMTADFGWRHEEFPLGRAGRPDDMAGAVAFLCSPDSAYITGTRIDVNGGTYFA